jgi:Flp pilus assembly protein TadG
MRATTGLLQRFMRREDGAIAIQFWFLLFPLLVMIFGTFDLSRASIAKAQLQDALDAANLIVARSTATTQQEMDAIGIAAIQANLQGTGVTLGTTHFVPNGNQVVGTASATVVPIIADLILHGNIPVNATSTVVRSNNHVELALVLDNTGSMSASLGSGSKIAALRSASVGLVDTLAAASQRSGDANSVKIAVVPFSMTVNVGSQYQNANWITGTQPLAYGADLFATANTNRFTMLNQMNIPWAGCDESRPAPYDIQDTAPNPSTPATMFVPYFAPDEPDDDKISNGGWGYHEFDNNYITNDKTSTTGSDLTAVRARQGRVNKYATSNMGNLQSGANGTGNFGPNRECGMQPIMRLTNDFTAVNTRLNSMVAVGNTNVPMGLIWGWHVLSPNAPFADGVAYSTPHVTKVVVLLTDGDNTNDETSDPNDSIYTGIGYIWQQRLLGSNGVALNAGSSDTDRMNALDSREAALCTNMRNQGIIIYAIGVGVSTHSRAILQACATDADHYYDVTNSSQLTAVFNTIAGEIQNLRISH